MNGSKKTRAREPMARGSIAEEKAVRFAKKFLSTPVLLNDIKASYTPQACENAIKFLEQKATNPDTRGFDVLVDLAAYLLSQHAILPEWLATFAADVLWGKRKRPTKRGLDKYVNFDRDYKLGRATHEVAKAFDLQHYSSNELSEQITAAEIVSRASGCTLDVVIKARKKHTRVIKALANSFKWYE